MEIGACRRQVGKGAEVGEVQAPNLGRESGCRGRGSSVLCRALRIRQALASSNASLSTRTDTPWGASSSRFPGSSSFLILMAKSEIRTIDLQHEPENRACQRANSCETDFAISIVFGDASLAQSSSRLPRVPDEFRECDQRSIAETVGGKPLLGALLTVDHGIETHDPRAEPLNDLTAGAQ